MRCRLAVLLVLGTAAPAAADPTLADMLGQASTCSDRALDDFASRTCEPPEKIAAMAVAQCQAKWNAVVRKAVGGAAASGAGKSLKIYSEAMEYEYIRVAELKAIDMRTASGRCGFE